MSNHPPRTTRQADEARVIQMERAIAPHAEGSCMVSFGHTKVLCTASVEENVPDWRKGAGAGWVTAEYSMLPRATHRRTRRERGSLGGRTQEIQRLIGRALRAAMHLEALGERQIIVDCDVLVADGGTRTAAISGAAIALHNACSWLVQNGGIASHPMRELVAAVSVGVVSGEVRLDLEYAEDVVADVDMNLVALESGGLVEVQGTAEHNSFSRDELNGLLDLGMAGINNILSIQREILGIELLVATRSAHKLAEIRDILWNSLQFKLVTLADLGIAAAPAEDDIEVYDSFLANATAKAGYFARLTGLRTLADDSGIAVDALGGRPGVRTRRFAIDHAQVAAGTDGVDLDRANNRLLLEKLAGIPDQERGAHYVCAAALSEDDHVIITSLGTCSGRIAYEEKGSAGFGYDPLFVIPALGISFAQLSSAQKNQRSHRAIAFRALATSIEKEHR